MDYLETEPAIDAKRVALLGASRLGKTVLWTGATDPRFAVILASVSGEGGAAISRRNYGETIRHITDSTRYDYQFAHNYQTYGDRVDQLPFDGHMLISLIAPRPLLLQTGDQDYWSDPKGEYLAAVAASPVWKLFGTDGLATDHYPAAGEPVLEHARLLDARGEAWDPAGRLARVPAVHAEASQVRHCCTLYSAHRRTRTGIPSPRMRRGTSPQINGPDQGSR